MSPRSLHSVVLLATALAGVACTESEPISSEPPPNDSAADAASNFDATSDATSEKVPATACQTGLPGAPLVRLPAPDGSYYCMDQREVTNAEYAAFLAAKGGDVSGQPKECEWNQSYTPKLVEPDDEPIGADECPTGSFELEKYPDYPVRCVDFCDAFAYCDWAGKRLCGQFGAPSEQVNVMSSDDVESAIRSMESEWFNACTQGGTTKFPYGNQYEANRCKENTRVPVTDLTSNACKGTSDGFTDIYDLSGSVEEWTNLCKPHACTIYGGAFHSLNPEQLACERAGLVLWSEVNLGVGIRCCADAVAAP